MIENVFTSYARIQLIHTPLILAHVSWKLLSHWWICCNYSWTRLLFHQFSSSSGPAWFSPAALIFVLDTQQLIIG